MTDMLSAHFSVMPVHATRSNDEYHAYIAVVVYGSVLLICWASSAEHGTVYMQRI
jgi:hypothetical protein